MKNPKQIYYFSIISLLTLALCLTAIVKPGTIEHSQAYSPKNISHEHNITASISNTTRLTTTTATTSSPISSCNETTVNIVETSTKPNTTNIDDNQIYIGRFKLTAYCPCSKCSGTWGKQTATGTTATEGRTVGVDPDIVEYGTELYIDGVGVRIAEDTGSGVNSKHIDIFMDSHSDCLEFGVKYADVYIVQEI